MRGIDKSQRDNDWLLMTLVPTIGDGKKTYIDGGRLRGGIAGENFNHTANYPSEGALY